MLSWENCFFVKIFDFLLRLLKIFTKSFCGHPNLHKATATRKRKLYNVHRLTFSRSCIDLAKNISHMLKNTRDKKLIE